MAVSESHGPGARRLHSTALWGLAGWRTPRPTTTRSSRTWFSSVCSPQASPEPSQSQTFSLAFAPGSRGPSAPTCAAGALWSSLFPKGVGLARGGPSGPGHRRHVMRWLLSSRMRVVMPLTCSRSSRQVNPFSSYAEGSQPCPEQNPSCSHRAPCPSDPTEKSHSAVKGGQQSKTASWSRSTVLPR